MITEPQSKSTNLFFHIAVGTIHRNRREVVIIFLTFAAILAVILPFSSVSSAPYSLTPVKPPIPSAVSTGQQTTPLSVVQSLETSLVATKLSARSSFVPEPFPLQAGGTPFLVTFDDVAPFTEVGSRYPHVVFSSPNSVIRTTNLNTPSSPPNTAYTVDTSGFGDFVITFPQPVNAVVFTVNACDRIGQVALVDLYQNGALTIANQSIRGNGVFSPAVVDYSQFNNITKVVVHDVIDAFGLSYDNVSFKLPAATPTPTPTPMPTPPPAPTGLVAKPDEEAIDLQWNPVPGATSYLIKRSNTSPSDAIGLAKSNMDISATVLSSAGSSALSNLVVIPAPITTYHDADVTIDVRYDYVIAAVGLGGTGPDSSPVWARPLPKNGCSETTLTPTNGGNDMFVNGGGWSMKYNITPNDGLMLRDISLNGRRMAARISVPYFRLETQTVGQNSVTRRGQLMPDGNSDGLRSRLIAQEVENSTGGVFFHVVYAIDQMPGTPKACLLISQDFQFFAPNTSPYNPPDWPGPCEPSGRTPDCAKFRPMIHYQFNPGSSNEFLKVINIPQRHHYEVGKFGSTELPTNRAGLFADANGEARARSPFVMGFERKFNPVDLETWARGIKDGRQAFKLKGGTCREEGPFDNFHQTWRDIVQTPPFSPGGAIEPGAGQSLVGPGCPECIHMHWRWGNIQNRVPFGEGIPLIYPFEDNQQASLDVAVVKWINGEEDPADYFQTYTCNGSGPIGPNDPPVFWYSASSSRPDDYMFWHTAWFKLNDPDKSNAKQSLLQSESIAPQVATQDGPLSINLGDVFEPGENHVETVGIPTLTEFPLLPPGYVALNNLAYKITTHADATGPVMIDFGAVSITDQTTFNNLRIFHTEVDPFDPEKGVWVDRTVLPPNSPAPDFSTRILTSRTDHLGVYVIGKLVQVVPPSTDRVSLSVISTDGPDPVMAGQALIYTITVTNTGPQTAHNVALRNELSSDVVYDSATASQGSCKAIEWKVYCNLGTLNVGSATVTLKVLPGDIPSGEYEVENSVTVRAAEQDDNASDDTSVLSTTVLANPNNPPTVALTTTSAPIVSGPASVQLTAIATDSDGSITKVEFFDNGEFIGTGVATGGGAYTFTATVQPCDPSEDHHDEQDDHHAPCGTHALVAIATDNGGRSGQSNSAVVFVNGAASVNITSPSSGAVVSPGVNLTLTATATNSTGSIKEVEFFANDVSLGHAVGSGNQYSLSWTNLRAGNFQIIAVARDANDVPSRSTPITITIGAPPTVFLQTPLEGTTFPSTTNIGLSAIATSTSSSVNKVEFYANGVLIGKDSGLANRQFFMTWRQPPNGTYSLTAVAIDVLGLTSTSAPVNIGVNATATRPGITVWFDDSFPQGATAQPDSGGAANDGWNWVDANPGAFSGTKSHQSLNFKLVAGNKIHAHGFDGATAKLHTGPNDVLFTYVFLDTNNLPREIMLEFKDASGWEHRAFWGDDLISRGVLRSPSRVYAGRLPGPGQWVRLQVDAGAMGLSNADISGMRFIVEGGRATFDYTGKAVRPFPELHVTTPGDTIWVDGAVPPGASAQVTDDVWEWIPCAVATKCHQSISPPFNTDAKFRQHHFTGGPPQLVNPGDVLFTQVLIDPAFKPDQIVIQWHDGTSWHRAYWGNSFQVVGGGVEGTETWRYMGGLPADLVWARLEVPASYVGLEGKYVSGMAFGFYRQTDNGQVIWGKSGKAGTASTVFPVLSPMTAVYQFSHSKFGYYYSTKSIPLNDVDHLDGIKFYVHPNQAAGTVPFYRFVNTDSTKREFYYSKIATSPNLNLWKPDGIAFYVYPDATAPGVVELNLFHETANPNHYFLSTANSVTGMIKDGVWAHVHPANPIVPTRPYFVVRDQAACKLNWLDSSNNESGFKIQRQASVCYIYLDDTGTVYERCFKDWLQDGVVGPNVTEFNVCTNPDDEAAAELETTSSTDEDRTTGPHFNDNEPNSNPYRIIDTGYRVIAFNDVGESAPSNEITDPEVCQGCLFLNSQAGGGPAIGPAPLSMTPTVDIASPLEGQVVSRELTVVANAFDRDGNGTLAKVELYDGISKIGELTGPAPYSLIWNNASNGPHTLTVVATDASGVSATSAPIHVTVTGAPSVTLTSPSSGTVVTALGSITLQATATDPENAVAKVEFFQGTVKLGEDTTSPYSFTWNTIQAGSYAVTARVIDNAGLTATSTVVPLTVNSPPTVELSAPTNGEMVTAPGTALLIANVADTDSSITKVDFYQGTALIGTSTTFPYTYNWTDIPFGTYNITAKVTDGHSAVTTSAPVTFIVNSAPSISITSPSNNFTFVAGSNLVISSSAVDADGTISQVQIYQGSTLLGTATAAGGGVYNYTWTTVAAGNHALTAKATDNRGAVTTTPAVNVISNIPPTVSITIPTNNAIFTAPATITIGATASDVGGTISKVDFYEGATLLGTDTSSPFTFTWPSVTPGTYSLTAKATDNNNAVTNSSAISVISNGAPTVSITSPANNAMFAAPANITIDASASDADGTITSVGFYQGSTLIGTDTTAPFSFPWNNVASGSHLLSARATDNRGATTTSVAVPVTTPTFYDDFNDNSLNLTKWHIGDVASPAVVSEQGQQLRITLPASTATYNGIGSNATYDMRGGTAQVELVQSVSQAGWVENFMMLEVDAQNYFMIQTGAGNLLLRSRVNGSNDQQIIPYDSIAHRFWRIRHSLSTNAVSFETSPDGVTWTTRKNVTAGFTLTAIRFVFIAGAWGTGNAAPGAAIYNDFQYIPDPSLPGTPAPILSDDFNDNSLDTSKWNPDNLFSGFTNLNVPMSETVQRLEIGPLLQNVNGSSYRGIRSVNTYNFSGAYAYVELVQAPSSTTSADAMFTVGKDVDYYYRIYVNAGNLIGQRKIAGAKTTLFTIPYDPVNHRFLRIRHDSVTGGVTLDTAPSEGGAPGAWVQRYSEIWNASVSLGAIIFEVKGGTWQIEANPPGKVIFDNFRVATNGP